jgi:hypothetical protein
MYNLEHLQFWRCYSGTQCCVATVAPNILKHQRAFIFMDKQSAVAANQILPGSVTHVNKMCNHTELSQILTHARGLHHKVQKLQIITVVHYCQQWKLHTNIFLILQLLLAASLTCCAVNLCWASYTVFLSLYSMYIHVHVCVCVYVSKHAHTRTYANAVE